MVKNPPANTEDTRDPGLKPGLGRSLRGGILAWEIPPTFHPSILAWEIPWTEEPGGLQSTGLQKSRTRLTMRARIN